MAIEDLEPISVGVDELEVLAQHYTKTPRSELKPQHYAKQFNSRKLIKPEQSCSPHTSRREEPTTIIHVRWMTALPPEQCQLLTGQFGYEVYEHGEWIPRTVAYVRKLEKQQEVYHE